VISCDGACDIDGAGDIIRGESLMRVCIMDGGWALGEGEVVGKFTFRGVDACDGKGRCGRVRSND